MPDDDAGHSTGEPARRPAHRLGMALAVLAIMFVLFAVVTVASQPSPKNSYSNISISFGT